MNQSMKTEFLADLESLIAIPTIRGEQAPHAPFGPGVRKGMDQLIDIAEREGLAWKDLDGYALHIEYGEGPLFGILCHIDTVGIEKPDQWKTDPFQLTVEGDMLYGRGVNDNKGPLLACLYLLIDMKRRDKQTNRKLRLIIGGAEETTWEGIRRYFDQEEMPEWAISPDGNFPIVNCEKGVRYYRICGMEKSQSIESIESADNRKLVCNQTLVKDRQGIRTYKGIEAPSRHPDRGVNSILLMCQSYEAPLEVFQAIQDFDGLVSKMEGYSTNFSTFSYHNGEWILELNLMWESDADPGELDQMVAQVFHAELEVLQESKARLYVSPEDPFLDLCRQAYREVTGREAKLLTKGGASYARVLKKGIAFGPCWPGEVSNQHSPNEQQSLSGLFRAMEVYHRLIEKIDNFGG